MLSPLGTGEPVRLSMPLGGLIGEVWVFPRELTADEVKEDFIQKRDRFRPALPVKPVLLREMNSVAFAPDYLRDEERIKPGRRPYDTTDFYQQFPEWSIHGKDARDTSRAIDYLQTLDFVDPEKIGMTGHSCGGSGKAFTACL